MNTAIAGSNEGLHPTQHPVRAIWLAFLVAGAAGTAATWFLLPHDSRIDTAWQPLFKVAVFLCLCLGISLAPNRSRYGHLIASLPFLAFLGYVLPRISYFTFFGGDVVSNPSITGEKYTFLYLLLYPGIVLSVALSFRMGGGAPGSTLKIGLIGALLLFSGYLDALWPLANGARPPAVVQAQHIKIILGRFATYPEVVGFALAHIPLLAVIVLLPLNRWLARLEVR